MLTSDEKKSFLRDYKHTISKVQSVKDNVKKLITIDAFEKCWKSQEEKIKKDTEIYDMYIDLISYEWRLISNKLSEKESDIYADTLP